MRQWTVPYVVNNDAETSKLPMRQWTNDPRTARAYDTSKLPMRQWTIWVRVNS